MKQLILLSMLTCGMMANPVTTEPVATAKKIKTTVYHCPKKSYELKTAMRKLWEDHVTYTRNYIISALADLGDVGAVATRLLKNQDDIGAAIKPFYGKPGADQLAKLLRDHIIIATKVVKAAKEGNKEALNQQQAAWKANADDIANFLHASNPHWKKHAMAKMLHTHLDLTTQEVVSRLQKNWDADIAAYDKGHVHMLHFSDMLVDGLTKQFPEKFECLCPRP